MNGKDIVTSLDRILSWITRLVILNLLWILFSVLGLIIVGVFPATVAALGVSRKWLMGNQDIKIWKSFKQIYREEFRNANISGWILAIIGGLLYTNYRLIDSVQGDISFIIPFAFYFVLFFYTIAILWIFPLIAHYRTKWLMHLKSSIIIGLSKIQYTLIIFLLIFLISYFSLKYPGILPFFSVSVASIGSMWISLSVFSGIDSNSKNR